MKNAISIAVGLFVISLLSTAWGVASAVDTEKGDATTQQVSPGDCQGGKCDAAIAEATPGKRCGRVKGCGRATPVAKDQCRGGQCRVDAPKCDLCPQDGCGERCARCPASNATSVSKKADDGAAANSGMGRGRGRGPRAGAAGMGRGRGRGPGAGAAGMGRGRGRGPGAGAAGMGRGRGRGLGVATGAGGPGHAGDAQHERDHEVFFFLIEHRDTITRSIKNLPDGIETVTESSDPEVAAKIQDHVESMYERLEQVNPIRMRDPLFREIFANADKIKMEVEHTEKGVRVKETSQDDYVVKLLQKHAQVVSLFIKNGYAELPKNHEAPTP